MPVRQLVQSVGLKMLGGLLLEGKQTVLAASGVVLNGGNDYSPGENDAEEDDLKFLDC